MIGFHLSAKVGSPLNSRLSLSSSVIGGFHALRATGILDSSLKISAIRSSISKGLRRVKMGEIVRFERQTWTFHGKQG